MGLYARYVLPHLISCACGARPILKQRAKVAPGVTGEVLELGFGGGPNVPFLDAGKITRLHAIEPEEGMRKLSEKAARAAPFPVTVHAEVAEAVALPAASIDTVFATYVLCTIPDPVSALAATRKFLKPGGKLVFCEHGVAPDADVAKTQKNVEPMWKRIAGGCHLSRDIPKIIADAGFRVEKLDTMYLPKTPRFAGFNYWGEARAA